MLWRTSLPPYPASPPRVALFREGSKCSQASTFLRPTPMNGPFEKTQARRGWRSQTCQRHRRARLDGRAQVSTSGVRGRPDDFLQCKISEAHATGRSRLTSFTTSSRPSQVQELPIPLWERSRDTPQQMASRVGTRLLAETNNKQGYRPIDTPRI